MLKKYTDFVNNKAGFTLLELLIVVFLVALIFGVTLPRMTISRQDVFPVTLERVFRYAAMSAMAAGSAVRIDFGREKIRVLKREWPYPKGVEPDSPVEITVNSSGAAFPAEIVFYKGKDKIRAEIGLLGVTIHE